MSPALTPAYLSYLGGEFANQLDELYKDDETPYGEAYRNKFRFIIQTYCQQHDQAGEQTAAFVELLPCNSEFGIDGAVKGLMILRQTREALAELLKDDADFLESYRGDNVTSEETDRSVRQDAREFTKRNEVSPEIDSVVRKTATEGEATEKEIMDASYNFQDGAKAEFDVALSARDRLPDDKPAKAASLIPVTPTVSPSVPAPQIDRPVFVILKKQTYFGGSPSIVFNRAKKWFVDAIIKIAAGSERHDHFPRIAPLVDKPELGAHATTLVELSQLACDIRDMTDRLRPPLSERFDDLTDMLSRAINKPGGGGPMQVEISDVMGSFGQMFGNPNEDKYGLGTEDWKKGGGDED